MNELAKAAAGKNRLNAFLSSLASLLAPSWAHTNMFVFICLMRIKIGATASLLALGVSYK